MHDKSIAISLAASALALASASADASPLQPAAPDPPAIDVGLGFGGGAAQRVDATATELGMGVSGGLALGARARLRARYDYRLGTGDRPRVSRVLRAGVEVTRDVAWFTAGALAVNAGIGHQRLRVDGATLDRVDGSLGVDYRVRVHRYAPARAPLPAFATSLRYGVRLSAARAPPISQSKCRGCGAGDALGGRARGWDVAIYVTAGVDFGLW